MQKDLRFYCHKFTKLRVDNAHGVAPHKLRIRLFCTGKKHLSPQNILYILYSPN